MAIILQKSWLLLHLLVFTAGFGYGFANGDVSVADADKGASSWTLVTSSGVGADGTPDGEDDDVHFLFGAASTCACPGVPDTVSRPLTLHRVPRYELQPRTTQGPPLLTV